MPHPQDLESSDLSHLHVSCLAMQNSGHFRRFL
jgi:hypothetical protein